MKIAIGCDHIGFKLKEEVKGYLKNHKLIDVGTDSDKSCDFSDFASKVAELVSKGECERGILICTTGTGMAAAANKFPEIIATNFYDKTEETLWVVKHDREHLNNNVLCMSGKFLDIEFAKKIIDIFLNTEPLKEERYLRRFNKVREIERKNMK